MRVRVFVRVRVRVRDSGPVRSLWPLLKTGLWMRNKGPSNVRKYFFASATIPMVASVAAKDLLDEIQHSGKAVSTLARDYVADWNEDWSDQRFSRR